MSTAASGSTLRAGAGVADITPSMGTQLAGDIGRYRPVEEVREPLRARALVVEAGGRTACILSLEVAGILDEWVEEVRRQAQARFGLAPESLMVHAIQNHAAPCIGHHMVSSLYDGLPEELWWVRGGDDRYNPAAVQGMLDAIEQALASLQSVSMYVGRGVDGRVAFNRRFIMRDGSGRCHPPTCDPSILHCEGPTDPEVGVMTFRTAEGRTLAALLHHTCHPCHGYPHRYVIADWPGAWAAAMEELLGPGCVPLVLNGCCGNTHHTNHLDPHHTNDHQQMGRKLAETTERVLARLGSQHATVVDWAVRKLRIPLREVEGEVLDAARRLIAEHPEPMWTDEARTSIDWEWVYAIANLDLDLNRQRRPYYDYEIQVIRIGDAAIVALVGEPFVEGQLRVKLESPAPFTFVAHNCNGFVGYLPTVEAFAHGGYETRTGNWSKLAPDALDIVVDETVALLRGLFAGP